MANETLKILSHARRKETINCTENAQSHVVEGYGSYLWSPNWIIEVLRERIEIIICRSCFVESLLAGSLIGTPGAQSSTLPFPYAKHMNLY